MADNIVTRLRDAWNQYDIGDAIHLIWEAADEIERLRARLDTVIRNYSAANNEISQLVEELSAMTRERDEWRKATESHAGRLEIVAKERNQARAESDDLRKQLDQAVSRD